MIRRAVEQRPDDGYIVDSLGWAHYRIHEYDEAVKQLERAVELKPRGSDHQRSSRRRLLEGRAHARGDVPVGACARPQAGARRAEEDRREAAHRADRRGRAGRDRQGRRRSRATAADGFAAGDGCAARSDLAEFAPAKVNLTLHVLGRRADGYHEIESLVVFADVGDRLTFVPGDALELDVQRPDRRRRPARPATISCSRRRARSPSGSKACGSAGSCSRSSLPVAAGLGGGSSDAAAALRLLARAERPCARRCARCARPRARPAPTCRSASIRSARMMRGIGEILSEPLALPELPAVLVNPGVAVPTRDVFAALAAPALSSSAPGGGFLPIDADAAALVSVAGGAAQRSGGARDQASAGHR